MKTEHFFKKSLTKDRHTSAIADHVPSTGHNIRWDHFEILTTGTSDIHCRIKEAFNLLIRHLKPALNAMLAVKNLFSTSIIYHVYIY